MMIRMYSKNDVANKTNDELVKGIKKLRRDINSLKYDYEGMDPSHYVQKSVLYDDLDILVDELVERKQENLIPRVILEERKHRNKILSAKEISVVLMTKEKLEKYDLFINDQVVNINKTYHNYKKEEIKENYQIDKETFFQEIQFIHFYDWQGKFERSLIDNNELWSVEIRLSPNDRYKYLGNNCYPVGFHHLVNTLRNHTI